MNENRVNGRKREFVFAGERLARGDTRSEQLAIAAVDFKNFACATVYLLADDAAEPHAGCGWAGIRFVQNGFGAE